MRIALIVALLVACGGKKDEGEKKDPPTPKEPVKDPPAAPDAAVAAEQPGSNTGPNTPNTADAPEGNPPADGKYERVMVEGVTVPMVNFMEGGTVLLVDTDGNMPRTWEEQYKI